MQQSAIEFGQSDSNRLKQQKKIASILKRSQVLVYYEHLWKYNKDGKCQDRILVLTSQALLNVQKTENILKSFMKKFVQFEDNYQIKRRIALQTLYGITISPNRSSNVFLIHVINDHDYYYKAFTSKLLFLQLICQCYTKVTKKELPFYFKEEIVILNYCTFKNHLKQKKDLKPKQKPNFLNSQYFNEKEFQDIDYICEYLQTEENKAIKPKHFARIDINKLKPHQKYYILKQQSNRSIHLNSLLQIPAILQPQFCFFNQKQQLMFVPFMIGGCFKNYIDKYLPLKREDIVFYVAQLILILEKISKENKVYRNVLMQNIYVKKNGYIVLDGFQSFSELNVDPVSTLSFKISGNPYYFSPQMVSCMGVQKGFEIWKIGVISYFLWKGHYPFQGKNLRQLYFNILKREIEEPDLPDFITKLLQKNVKKRMRFQELKNHKDFAGMNWKNLQQERIKAPFLVNIQNWNGKLPIIYQLCFDTQ